MSTKYDISQTYIGEMIELQRLFVITRTTTGVLSFTSSTSGVTYNSATGEKGIFEALQTALLPYQITASDFNQISTDIATVSNETSNKFKKIRLGGIA